MPKYGGKEFAYSKKGMASYSEAKKKGTTRRSNKVRSEISVKKKSSKPRK